MEESMVRLVGLVGGQKVDEEDGGGAEVEVLGVSTPEDDAGVRGRAMEEGGGETT